jgi:hypothetical protein
LARAGEENQGDNDGRDSEQIALNGHQGGTYFQHNEFKSTDVPIYENGASEIRGGEGGVE